MSLTSPKLYFFHPGEFTRGHAQWYSAVDRRLLVLLDTLRFMWGKPIHISKHPSAVGRHAGGENDSQHNFDRWGVVRAVDIQPEGIASDEDAYHFYKLAVHLGFTGIGIYPEWIGGVGFHLDTRPDRDPGYPATWGQVSLYGEVKYVSANDAIEAIEEAA